MPAQQHASTVLAMLFRAAPCVSLTHSAGGYRWYMGAERKARRKKAENMKMPACQELKDQGYDVGY